MPGRLRFRQVSEIRLTEEETITHKAGTDPTRELMRIVTIEYPIYDVLLEAVSLSPKLQLPDTGVKKVTLADLPVGRIYEKGKPKWSQQTSFHEAIGITNVCLIESQIRKLPVVMNTEITREMQKEITGSVEAVPSFDISLTTRIVSEQFQTLNTEVITTEVKSGIEILRLTEETELPVFEEFIECDGRFPRGFSESLNSPFILLIGEDECEWHIPIIYVLKELFREITDRHPKVTFREPEVLEEGVEERVDSIDPHSLEQFAFEHKIEFLDARKMRLAVDKFARIVKGRLSSAFLQQFGILVVAVKRRDLERARRALKVKGIRVYTCNPDDSKYEQFCSKVLGISSLGDFFSNLKVYRECLDRTVRRFSVFVRRGADATDKFQYPLKVATFVYLLDELRKRRKRLINDFEKLCEFVKEIRDKIKIEGEDTIGNRKIIPDLIYSPEGEEIYIEIETLIGTLEPMKKIDETIEKYEDSPRATNIWIVLRPVSALLHYEELKARKKAYKALYKDKKIEFKVLNLLVSKGKFKWELVSLDRFLGDVRLAKRI